MSKFIKGLLQQQTASVFDNIDSFFVISTCGLSGNDNNAMRGALCEKGIKLSVVKNSLMRRAMLDKGYDAATELFAAGPCTVAFGGDSVVDIAKEIVDYAKKFDAVVIKGAFLDGTAVDEEGAKAISKMPTRVELQGQIAQIALTPGGNVAGALMGPAGVIAGCLKSIIEKAEEAA